MAVVKKKTMRLPEMLDTDLVKSGEVLRYKNKAGELLAVGLAEKAGIFVPSHKAHYSFTKFEDITKSNYHRPCQFTYAPSSISLQDLVNDEVSWLENDSARQTQRHWGLTRRPQPVQVIELASGRHDEHCIISSQKGGLLECKACTIAIHPSYLEEEEVANAQEWYCPKCRCAASGRGIPAGTAIASQLDQTIWLKPDTRGFLAWSPVDLFLHPAQAVVAAPEFDQTWPELAPRLPAAQIGDSSKPDDSAKPMSGGQDEAGPSWGVGADDSSQKMSKKSKPVKEPRQVGKSSPGNLGLTVFASSGRVKKGTGYVERAVLDLPPASKEDQAREMPAALTESFDVGMLLEAAGGTTESFVSETALKVALDSAFPSAMGSKQKAQALVDMWVAMFPDRPQDERLSRPERLGQIHDALIMISRGKSPTIVAERAKKRASEQLKESAAGGAASNMPLSTSESTHPWEQEPSQLISPGAQDPEIQPADSAQQPGMGSNPQAQGEAIKTGGPSMSNVTKSVSSGKGHSKSMSQHLKKAENAKQASVPTDVLLERCRHAAQAARSVDVLIQQLEEIIPKSQGAKNGRSRILQLAIELKLSEEQMKMTRKKLVKAIALVLWQQEGNIQQSKPAQPQSPTQEPSQGLEIATATQSGEQLAELNAPALDGSSESVKLQSDAQPTKSISEKSGQKASSKGGKIEGSKMQPTVPEALGTAAESAAADSAAAEREAEAPASDHGSLLQSQKASENTNKSGATTGKKVSSSTAKSADNLAAVSKKGKASVRQIEEPKLVKQEREQSLESNRSSEVMNLKGSSPKARDIIVQSPPKKQKLAKELHGLLDDGTLVMTHKRRQNPPPDNGGQSKRVKTEPTCSPPEDHSPAAAEGKASSRQLRGKMGTGGAPSKGSKKASSKSLTVQGGRVAKINPKTPKSAGSGGKKNKPTTGTASTRNRSTGISRPGSEPARRPAKSSTLKQGQKQKSLPKAKVSNTGKTSSKAQAAPAKGKCTSKTAPKRGQPSKPSPRKGSKKARIAQIDGSAETEHPAACSKQTTSQGAAEEAGRLHQHKRIVGASLLGVQWPEFRTQEYFIPQVDGADDEGAHNLPPEPALKVRDERQKEIDEGNLLFDQWLSEPVSSEPEPQLGVPESASLSPSPPAGQALQPMRELQPYSAIPSTLQARQAPYSTTEAEFGAPQVVTEAFQPLTSDPTAATMPRAEDGSDLLHDSAAIVSQPFTGAFEEKDAPVEVQNPAQPSTAMGPPEQHPASQTIDTSQQTGQLAARDSLDQILSTAYRQFTGEGTPPTDSVESDQPRGDTPGLAAGLSGAFSPQPAQLEGDAPRSPPMIHHGMPSWLGIGNQGFGGLTHPHRSSTPDFGYSTFPDQATNALTDLETFQRMNDQQGAMIDNLLRGLPQPPTQMQPQYSPPDYNSPFPGMQPARSPGSNPLAIPGGIMPGQTTDPIQPAPQPQQLPPPLQTQAIPGQDQPSARAAEESPALVEQNPALGGEHSQNQEQTEPSPEPEPVPKVVTNEDVVDDNASVVGPAVASSDEDVPLSVEPFRLSGAVAAESAAAESVVVCLATGRKAFTSSLTDKQRARVAAEKVWVSTASSKQSSLLFAQIAARGLIKCSPTIYSQPLHWQLIHGASLSQPQGSRGVAIRLSEAVKQTLRASLIAARNIIAETCGPLADKANAVDLIPQMLQGKTEPDCKERHGAKDLSSFQTALLWIGSSLVSVALVRVFGDLMAEIPVFCTRPAFQGTGMMSLLFRHLEAALIRCGVNAAIMPAVPLVTSPDVPSEEDISEAEAEKKYHGERFGYSLLSTLTDKSTAKRVIALPKLNYGETPVLYKKLLPENLPEIRVPAVGEAFEDIVMKPSVSQSQDELRSAWVVAAA